MECKKQLPEISLTHSLGHLTGLSSRLFNRVLTSRFKQAGIYITAEQWGVILILKQFGSLSQSQICEILYLEKSSVSRSIEVLEKNGWVHRFKSHSDNRTKLVKLTEQSLNIVVQCSDIANGVLQDSQKEISPENLSESEELLGQVVTNLRSLLEL
ncbi:MarR family winged helix-turn-helix transcriptional regulator [Pseudoalteromonas sp. 68 DY56-GL68]|uniref:MarR family winged helix-turn-helix transcriptional regulator n=1 Tax=Pseudoalteromonas sp. 68 DY56-GL68 TaxID=2974919 RepID=UPI00352A12B1